LRRSRKQAGLTQEALRDSSGIHMTEISRIENGQKDPQLTTIVRLAIGLDVPAGELLAGLGGTGGSTG
jgi:XRE family transcriptional regulator, regulator of sulfur utilization